MVGQSKKDIKEIKPFIASIKDFQRSYSSQLSQYKESHTTPSPQNWFRLWTLPLLIMEQSARSMARKTSLFAVNFPAPTISQTESEPTFRRICRLHLQCRRISHAKNQRITQRYIPEDRTLHNQRLDNLSAHIKSRMVG
jgi:hypothetical protein